MIRKSKRFVIVAPLLLVVLLATGCLSIFKKDEIVATPGIPSLREIYQDYFEIGAAVSIASWSDQTFYSHRHLIEKHFSSLTAENEMKPDGLQPRPNEFNFQVADRMVDFAYQNNIKVRGHTLLWHAQTPDWFFRDNDGRLIHEKVEITPGDKQLVRERLENHIEKVMEHYAGKVYVWDVVNEAMSDNLSHTLREESPWYQILGDEFMEIAFKKAFEVDPNVKLFYNDYNPEMVYKRDRTKRVLEGLLAKGVPIHGIGIQGHWDVNGTSIEEIEDAINIYANLGIEIHITELDVGLNGESLEAQAERYRELFTLFKKHSDVIKSVTLWGISDEASWRAKDEPLLFDKNQDPKPAFWAIVNTEKSWEQNRDEHLKE